MTKRRKSLITLFSALALVAVTAVTARALINPNFTPQMLVEQSTTILIVRLNKPDAKNRIPLEVVKVPKGKKPTGKVFVDLSAANQKAWAKHVGKLAASRGADPVPLFIGKYKEATEGEDAEAIEGALLQIDRDWVRLFRSKKDKNVWEMSHVDSKLQGTWDGGSDMLIKAIDYIKENPDDARVPVEIGYDWVETKNLGKIAGGASGLQAVDLGAKCYALFVGAGGGDKLFLWDKAKKKFEDITAARKLAASSRAFAWADYDGDGRLDLASWDGAGLSLRIQAADGTFAKKVDVPLKPEGGCLRLAAVDAGVAGKAGILVSTGGVPLLLRPAGEGKYAEEKLPAGSADRGKLGAASPCLAADLDADGLFDVLQPFEKGGLVYRGKLGGKSAAATAVDICTGKGRAFTCAGDYDMDGLLEVYMVGRDCCRLWSNKGKLKFADAFGHSGEMCYTAQPGGVGAQTCDLNNDGLQDLLVVYGEEPVHHYFNRGYRSFGKSLSTIWENEKVQADTAKGQQAGICEDVNGDGGQDMILVLKDGTLKVYVREVYEDEPVLFVRAVLPAKSRSAGPVTVTGWNDRRCLGAWNVSAGGVGALFGQDSPGEITLKYRFPGGKTVTKKVTLDKKSKRLELVAGAAAPSSGGGRKAPVGASKPGETPEPATGAKPAPAPAPAPGAKTEPNWLLIGGCGAAVVVLLIVLLAVRKKKSE